MGGKWRRRRRWESEHGTFSLSLSSTFRFVLALLLLLPLSLFYFGQCERTGMKRGRLKEEWRSKDEKEQVEHGWKRGEWTNKRTNETQRKMLSWICCCCNRKGASPLARAVLSFCFCSCRDEYNTKKRRRRVPIATSSANRDRWAVALSVIARTHCLFSCLLLLLRTLASSYKILGPNEYLSPFLLFLCFFKTYLNISSCIFSFSLLFRCCWFGFDSI